MGSAIVAKGLVVHPEKCTGCFRCALWCSLKKDKVHNPSRARLHVLRREPSLDTPVVCLQCGLCIGACPFDAIHRNVKTGAAVIDIDTCTGCGICILSCPYGMLKYAPDSRIPLKCDLCGGKPECVKHCRDGALTYEDPNHVAAERREVYARTGAREPIAGSPKNLLVDRGPQGSNEG
jgi:carbon-monoxide dehydrogenase iron sulfur subunit